ncbi:MAG: TSUP family transporter [Rhizobiaceae bacterium]|nr:TSUP family transporter [Rhizobiaceae bacterium]
MTDLGLTDLLPTLDPTLTVIFAAIFLLAGIIKGFLGIGLPAAAVGLLTLFVPPAEAIPLLWLPILGTNILQFAHAPQKRKIVSDYIWFAMAIMISIFITSMFMADYPTALLTVSIGIAMVVFSTNLLLGIKLPIRSGLGWQIGAGLLAGIFGGLSSIWSPIVAMYLVARNVPKEQFIGVTGFLFLAGCLPLGAGQFIAGLISLPVLLKSLAGLIVVLIGFRIGEEMRKRVSQTQFRNVVLFAFLIMGIRLIAIGFT